MKLKAPIKVVTTEWRIYVWGGPQHRQFLRYEAEHPPQTWNQYRYANLGAGPDGKMCLSAKTGTYVLVQKPTLHYRWKGWNK